MKDKDKDENISLNEISLNRLIGSGVYPVKGDDGSILKNGKYQRKNKD